MTYGGRAAACSLWFCDSFPAFEQLFSADSVTAQEVQSSIQAAVTHLRGELTTQFATEIKKLHAQIQSLTANKKARLPDVMKLDGPASYDVWLLEMKGKIWVDGDAIGDDCARTYYIYNRLEPKVKDFVIPQIHHAERTDNRDDAPQRVLQALDCMYANF